MLPALLLAVAVFCKSFANAQDPVTYFNGMDHDAYLQWLQDSSYEHSTFLPSPEDPLTGVALHWNITNDTIYLAVAARAEGWVGFGITESGGMQGADPVIFMASDNALIDSYILELVPIPDDSQSWTLSNSQTDGGFLIFDAVRLLDTGDPQDHPIVQYGDPGLTEPSRIIAAWSDSDNLQYHGPNNRVGSAIRFFATGEDSFQSPTDTRTDTSGAAFFSLWTSSISALVLASTFLGL